jgi:hypothetical protein
MKARPVEIQEPAKGVMIPEPIVIHVAGGGAQVVSKPLGVIVEVHDFDTPSDTGETVETFAWGDEIREGEPVIR